MPSVPQITEPSPYDLQSIQRSAGRTFRICVSLTATFAALLLMSAAALIFYGKQPAVFIISAIILCASAAILAKQLRELGRIDRSLAYGEIVDVHKEVKAVSTTSVGGVNPFGMRRYDSYKREDTRLTVSIREGDDDVFVYYLNGVTADHVEYYEAAGKALHIPGTRFPLRLNVEDDVYLCPFCGEFNTGTAKTCSSCRSQVFV